MSNRNSQHLVKFKYKKKASIRAKIAKPLSEICKNKMINYINAWAYCKLFGVPVGLQLTPSGLTGPNGLKTSVTNTMVQFMTVVLTK